MLLLACMRTAEGVSLETTVGNELGESDATEERMLLETTVGNMLGAFEWCCCYQCLL